MTTSDADAGTSPDDAPAPKFGGRHDVVAGAVLGVESVPDGLANGLLAGVNPVAGLYAYLFGAVGAALVTGSSFMVVQGTGAMAAIVSDIGLGSRPDPERALFTLSIVTGGVMIAAGLLRASEALRFVSMAVMVGFMGAVGVNIVLGQLETITGYASDRGDRITRALDTVLHPGALAWPTLLVGLATMALIVVLERSRLGASGMVVAIGLGSGLAALLDSFGRPVELVGDISEVPASLPTPVLPSLSEVPVMIVPAMSLAFVGLVSGAAIASSFPNGDGHVGDPRRNFVGQGVGNVVSGLFRGVPVGGSTSASALVVEAGARTRYATVVAGAVMAVVILVGAGAVRLIAMPSLAALLIVIGVRTVKPERMLSAIRTGRIEAVVVVTTFVLTMIVPLQYSVLVGVGISVILHVVRQSEQLTLVRLETNDEGRTRETELPTSISPGDIIVVQPHGSLFFASAPALERQLPAITSNSSNAVVIIRLRGMDNLGVTSIEVIRRYANALSAAGSKLVIVVNNDRVHHQLSASGLVEELGSENVYEGTEWLGEATTRAHSDAEAWIESRT